MTQLLNEIVRDLEKAELPSKLSFGKPLEPTDTVLCKMTEGMKKLWLLRSELETEKQRLDLRIRQLLLEARDMPEPPQAVEDLKDQYTRMGTKYYAIDVLLSASLAYEFENFRRAKDSPIIREEGMIVTEVSRPQSLLIEALLALA